jgi:hypothetical protein
VFPPFDTDGSKVTKRPPTTFATEVIIGLLGVVYGKAVAVVAAELPSKFSAIRDRVYVFPTGETFMLYEVRGVLPIFV